MSATAKASHVWARDPLDWYVEPEVATDALLAVERFNGIVWDPCCGGGNIPRALIRAGYDAIGSDITTRAGSAGQPWFMGERDFLAQERAANICMNPPFFKAKGAEAFIRHALAIASGKVAAFVDIRFLTGSERARGLWADHPPARAYIVTPRVSCPPGTYLAAGGKAGNGSSDWCWLVWDKTAPSAPTTLSWLRRAA